MSKPGDCTGDKGWRLSSPVQDVSDETLLTEKVVIIISLLQYHDSYESDNHRYSSLLIERHVRCDQIILQSSQ